MGRVAKDEICFGRHIPIEEVLGALEGVSEDAISEVAQEMLDSHPFCITLLGSIEEKDLPWEKWDL